jgi:nitrogen-specific signal transduction histidine kinase
VAEQTRERLQQQIAERERAEGALRQAQRIEAIGQLTGGVAHDFNNLLTVVLGNVEILQRRAANGTLDGQSAGQLAAIRSAAERGAMLTRHMLAFARRQPLLPKPVALSVAISGMRDLLESALGKKALLEFRLATDLWPAMADQSQIELVILNLVINARDAIVDTGSDRGLVTIETRNHHRREAGDPDGPPAGDYVRIIVRDNGTGMPPEVVSRVFEPFFTTKPPGVGSGLGLSQVFGTARQSGGAARIESEVGKGTAVIVDLPRAASPPTEAPAPPEADLDVTVLLVDRDDAERQRIGAMLRAIGCDVKQAAGGDAALALLRQDRGIDILLTDLATAGSDGTGLVAAARSICPEIAVVFVTAYADQGLGRLATVAPILRKPFDSRALHRAIAAGLTRRTAAI